MNKISIGLIGCLIVLLLCSPYQVAATGDYSVTIDVEQNYPLEVGQQLQLSFTLAEGASYKSVEWFF